VSRSRKQSTSGLKTRPNDASVAAFLNGIADEQPRKDAFTVLALMKKLTNTLGPTLQRGMQHMNSCRTESPLPYRAGALRAGPASVPPSLVGIFDLLQLPLGRNAPSAKRGEGSSRA
jgi:hypothetical protein